jgi:hypothetical protein
MSSRALRSAATAGAVGALISIITALAVPAGVMSDDASPTWNTIDLVTDVLLAAGLVGFSASGAARGRLARIGLSLAFAGLAVFALAAVHRAVVAVQPTNRRPDHTAHHRDSGQPSTTLNPPFGGLSTLTAGGPG